METRSFYLLNKVQEDLRVGPAHISLMAAILKIHEQQNRELAILITGKDLQKLSRIGSKGTYYKYIADLQRFGYIQYQPLHKGKRQSRIFINSSEAFKK